MTEKLHLEPLLVDEIIAHLNYSMEMDDRHAAMALRGHWPRLRDELELLLKERSRPLADHEFLLRQHAHYERIWEAVEKCVIAGSSPAAAIEHFRNEALDDAAKELDRRSEACTKNEKQRISEYWAGMSDGYFRGAAAIRAMKRLP